MIRIPPKGSKRPRVPDSDESFNEESAGSDFEAQASDASDSRPRRLRRTTSQRDRPKRLSSRQAGKPKHRWDFSTDFVVPDDDEDESEEGDYDPAAERRKARAAAQAAARAAAAEDEEDYVEPSAGEEADESQLPTPGHASPAPSKARQPTASTSHAPPTRVPSQVVKGEVYRVVDEELELAVDASGESKIDADGNLQGGRQFNLHTFISPQRHPTRKYILGVEAGRMAGFKESSPFFRSYPLFYKLKCTAQEREMLIGMGILHSNARFRSATIITARSVYKLLGAMSIVNGKHVVDDYYEQKALNAGKVSGESATVQAYDPADDRADSAGPSGGGGGGGAGGGLGLPKDLLDRSETKLQFGGHGATPFAKWDPAAKQRRPAPHLTPTNWTLEYAKAVQSANAAILGWRKEQLGTVALTADEMPEEEGEQQQQPAKMVESSARGQWDSLTNVALVPQHTQPTTATAVRVDKKAQQDARSYDIDTTRQLGLISVTFEARPTLPGSTEQMHEAELRGRMNVDQWVYRDELRMIN